MTGANPFEILTFIVAPAILTNSSSVLSLSTSNRFARVVERSRFLYERLKDPGKLPPRELEMYQKQLPVVGQRSLLLVRALTCFYVSVGAFAATAFVSIIGAGIALFDASYVSKVTIVMTLVCGAVGVIGLVSGTGLLVREMWLALNFLQKEVELAEAVQVDP
ncbi:MAG TPA: DUF2721 domain-containing protein, partial [Oculatellaceae cyanobacterium]